MLSPNAQSIPPPPTIPPPLTQGSLQAQCNPYQLPFFIELGEKNLYMETQKTLNSHSNLSYQSKEK